MESKKPKGSLLTNFSIILIMSVLSTIAILVFLKKPIWKELEIAATGGEKMRQ
jgi:hypothetical protein